MAAGTYKPNYKILGIGTVLLLPPGWRIFQGALKLDNFPIPIALFTIGALAVIAITLMHQGLLNVETEDSPVVQFGVAGLILLAEFVAQWWFAITESQALVMALIFSMMSLGGAVIIETEIMRVWRQNGRRTGRLSLPPVHVDANVRKEFPEVASIWRKLAVRNPNATAAAVRDEAFSIYDERVVEAPVQVRVDVVKSPGRGRDTAAITSGHVPDGPALSVAGGGVSEQVKALMDAGITDTSALQAALPGHNRDSVRKAAARIRTAS